MGTAGSLSLLQESDDPLLVINGDILTQVDFRAMLQFHQEHNADMTVAVRSTQTTIPYGVVDVDGIEITGVQEKPVLTHLINAGIYLLEPSTYSYIPNGEPYDMTDLIARLLENERPVAAFPIREYWLYIGQHEDYDRAQSDTRDGKVESNQGD